jgi:hypothetical protein
MAPIATVGVMPEDTASGAVSAPESRISPAPLAALPMLKYVSVSEPAVAAGKAIAAAFEYASPLIVQPPVLRATAKRA